MPDFCEARRSLPTSRLDNFLFADKPGAVVCTVEL
jgi:hypothetical protein